MVTTELPSAFRALIVDDDDIVRRVLSRAMSEEGFECDSSCDGDHALDLLTAGDGYDLLVTDLRMPGKNGHSLSIEALKVCPQLVVIVHTAVDEPRLAKDLIFRGVDDVVSKPTNYSVFAAKARGYVARRRQLGDSALEAFSPQHATSRTDPATGTKNRGRDASQAENHPVGADEVEQRLEEIEHLFPLSHAAFDVYSMATRDESEPEEMAARIEQDASLTAEVLRLANSSHSGSRQPEIESVSQAIVRLGRRSIGQLAVSAGGRQALAGHDLPWIDRDLFWKRSLVAATALRTLKAQAAVHTENSEFLGALLHPVGRIVLATLFPDQHREIAERCRESGESLDAAEKKAFGLNHGQVGMRLLASWGISTSTAHLLEHVAAPFAQLGHHPEAVRHRIENVKLSILLARIATCCWEPWDMVDLPSGDAFNRLGIESIAETLSAIRNSFDSSLLDSDRTPPEQSESDSVPEESVLEVDYRARGESTRDVLPSLLSSLGVHVLEGHEEGGQPVVINGLYRGPGLEQLVESTRESRPIGIVRDKEAASFFAPGASIFLPTTVQSLCVGLQAAGAGATAGAAEVAPAV